MDNPKDFSFLFSEFHHLHKNEYIHTAHSHHFWPDVTRDAQLKYWDDSARLVDDKWDLIFNEKWTFIQNEIAKILKLTDPAQLAFASNTHEFVVRILSLFDPKKKIKILTTDSEFYSFERQISRLEEDNLVEVTRIPTLPLLSFEDRFKKACKNFDGDLVFFSHVFFNSGYAIEDLNGIVSEIKDHIEIVVDGYHGFMALPTSLTEIENRCFYTAGSYKYAMAGEGLCFLHVPKRKNYRPLNTGWFAEFGELQNRENDSLVPYAKNGNCFMGATKDFSCMYRLEAVFKMLKDHKITIERIHDHVQMLQFDFLNMIDELSSNDLNRETLLLINQLHHGHFLTFKLETPKRANEVIQSLKTQRIQVDGRGDRVRFGFGLHHECPLKLPIIQV